MGLNPVLREALRKEALQKKRQQDKKEQREKQRFSGREPALKEQGHVLDSNEASTSVLAQGRASLPKTSSRWETGGANVEAECATEEDSQPQSLMARMAHAEITAFRKNYGVGKDSNVGHIGEESCLLGPQCKPVGSGNQETTHAGPGSGATIELGDLNELDSGEILVSDEADDVSLRGEEMIAGPARPDATIKVNHDQEMEHEGNRSKDAMFLDSNKQHLFKRKMSMMQSCRDVDHYEKLNRISEGTYGVVYRGRDLETMTVCALKRLKLEKERSGFPLTSVREINVLLALEHPNIVNVSEVVMGRRHANDPRDDQIFMVMEYADHDLDSLNYRFSIAEIKCLMVQLLSGVAYLHDNYVMHRDLKPANILYNNKGQLKICDFGLARQFSAFPKDYTQMVVTLWYRAPELLLGTRKYSSAVDVWSVGCIMAQLLIGRPLLTGNGEIDQIKKTYNVIGNPKDREYFETLPLWDKCKHIKRSEDAPRLADILLEANVPITKEMIDLLHRLLDLNPETRVSARDALDHPWFACHPLAKDVALMPTFPPSNEQRRVQPPCK
jgi:cell division cycle 2-like protein